MTKSAKPDPKKLLKARKLLAKARLYRFVAFCFAVVGILIFLYFYLVHVEGQFKEAIKSPYIVVLLLFPFVPAAVLSWLSLKTEDKFFMMMRQSE